MDDDGDDKNDDDDEWGCCSLPIAHEHLKLQINSPSQPDEGHGGSEQRRKMSEVKGKENTIC